MSERRKFVLTALTQDICPGCHKALLMGETATLVPIGPGDDEEEREKARNGRAYNAVAILAHYACVTGFTS